MVSRCCSSSSSESPRPRISPDRAERHRQRLDRGGRLSGEQASHQRAVRKGFESGGTLDRRVEGALVDVETRALDPEVTIVGLQFGDAVEVPSGGCVVANSADP